MENNSKKQITTLIKIDPWSIIKIILIFVGFWFLYLIKDVILIVLSGIFLAAVINPGVNFFERKKFPRWLGASIIYLIILLIIVFIIFVAGTTIKGQFNLFINSLPNYLKLFFHVSQDGSNANFIEFLNNWFNKGVPGKSNVFSMLSSLTGQLVTSFMIFVIAFYLSVEKRASILFINSIVPPKYKKFTKNFIDTSSREIGAWARATLFLALVIGILTYLCLLFLGIKFSLVLAFLAAIGEFIPWIGPWIAATPAVIVALTQSPTKAILVPIFYVIIQQIGNVFITPHVMHRAVGLDPLLIIIVLLIGSQIAGPWGLILAVPITTVIVILVKDYLKLKQSGQIG